MDGDIVIEGHILNDLTSQQAATSQSGSGYAESALNHSIYMRLPILQARSLIRVLDLEKSSQLEDPLVGSIRLVPFDQDIRPEYNALSYVWGSWAEPKDTLQIKPGAGMIAITRNCRDALRHVRLLYGDTSIWVDAVCIDQNSDAEKAHQIPLIKEIYTWAQFVYVWLGMPVNPAICRAMISLTLAADLYITPPNRNPNGKSPTLQTILLKFMTPYFNFKMIKDTRRLASLKDFEAQDFVMFFSQDWFLRAWTFQEIVFASNPVVIYGSHTVRWEALLRGFRWLKKISLFEIIDHGQGCVLFYGNPQPPGQTPNGSSSSDGLPLTHIVQAFDGIVDIWIRVARPIAWAGRSREINAPMMQSFYDHQKHYIRLENGYRFLWFFNAQFFFLSLLWPLGVLTITSAFKDGTQLLLLGLFTPACAFLTVLIYLFGRPVPSSITKQRPLSLVERVPIADALMDGIVQALRQRQATEPKDRSYAIYGVLAKLDVQLSPIEPKQSLGEVYHTLLLDLIRWNPACIVLLLDACRPRNWEITLNRYPSWVPDWSKLHASPTISAHYFLRHRELDATPGVEPQVKFGLNLNILIVHGHWRGHVIFCTANFPTIGRSSASVQEAIAGFGALILALEVNHSPSRPHGLEYLYSGINLRAVKIFDLGNTIVPATIPLDEYLPLDLYLLTKRDVSVYADDNVLSKMRALCTIFRPTEVSRYSPERVSEIALVLQQNEEIFDFFIEFVNNLSSNERRMFVTSEGFRGCGSRDVAVEDRIALVAGVPAPLILRPTDNNKPDWFETEYSVSSSAFIVGWMDGSAFNASDLANISLI